MGHLKLKLVGPEGRILETRRLATGPRLQSYSNLVRSIDECDFQGLTEFAVEYVDDEGDRVRVTSDEELRVSLSARGGPRADVIEFLVCMRRRPAAKRGPAGGGVPCAAATGLPRVLKEMLQHKNARTQKAIYCARACARACGAAAAEKAQTGGAASPPTEVVHAGIVCDGCGAAPIRGIRFKCKVRPDYDLCAACRATDESGHEMLEVKEPMLPTLGQFLAAAEAASTEALVAEAAAEDEVVATSLSDTKADALAHEAEGATAESLDQVRLATMASLESLAQETAQETVRDDAGAHSEEKASSSEDSSEKEYVVVKSEAAAAPSFKPGQLVEVHSVSTRAYEGARGTVRAAPLGGRIIVELLHGGETIALKAANLKPVQSPSFAAELAQLDDMGFIALLGKPEVLKLIGEKAHANGTVDLDAVVADIISKFDEI